MVSEIPGDVCLRNWRSATNAGADPGFGQGGGPGPEAESCRHSEAELCEQSEQFVAGVQGLLKALEAFGFLMLKYAFSHILETLFL